MVFRHHKGGLYRLLFTAVDSTNETAGRLLVIYVSLTTGRTHARDADEFHGCVDDGRKRFELIGEKVDVPRVQR